eukprot:SAG31_NODE_23041_length_512_cov_1.753027_1_plen_104_part_00
MSLGRLSWKGFIRSSCARTFALVARSRTHFGVSAPLPGGPRLGGSLALVNGQCYCVGGVSDSEFTRLVERYDQARDAWVPCPSMEAPQAYHACFAAGLCPLYD